jgi:HTH-type transcriptional regulator, sugar sensing transcriptional regulator
MDVNSLREIGLTEGEIKVYIALLGLGETTSGPIVRESGVSLSKVYLLLSKLAQKGLVSNIMKKDTKYFKASVPSRLLNYLTEKREDLMVQEKNLKALIPVLESRYNSNFSIESAQVYEGLKGIQTARERTMNIMRKGDEMWIIGIAPKAYDNLTPYFAHYHQRRYAKGIKCYYLYNEEARKPFGEASAKYPLSEVRYMPKDLVTFAWMEIYVDTVTIGMNDEKPISVVIQNQEIANSFKVYARLLWEMGNI